MCEPLTLTRAELDAAAAVVYTHIAPTPQYAWPLLSAALGAEVWVKHENCTPIGAFKVRGGLTYVQSLRERRPDVPGIVSATRGNHGMSLAYAGAALGVPVTIVVPTINSREKNAAMTALGAEVVEVGSDFQEAREHAQDLAEHDGRECVSPFHRDLVAGVATYARELFLAAGRLDVVYVGVGMGSGACGLIAVRDALGAHAEIVGVVSERAPATALSFDAHEVVNTARADTFVDGVATRAPDPVAMATLRAGLSRVVSVSDDEVAEAMRIMFRATHHLPEPAGAIAMAGLMRERVEQSGRRVGVILSGCNMDTAIAATVLSGRTPAPA